MARYDARDAQSIHAMRAAVGSVCPRCGAHPKRFVSNGTRKRIFFSIVDGLVVRKTGALPCWKCPECRKAFTQYPDFAIPYKRFVRQTIESLCAHYLSDAKASYRVTVTDAGMPIFYPERVSVSPPVDCGEDVDVDYPLLALSHTALYRWVTTLAGHDIQAPEGEEQNASAPPHIAYSKFRSRRRQQILLRCRQVLGTPKPPR